MTRYYRLVRWLVLALLLALLPSVALAQDDGTITDDDLIATWRGKRMCFAR